MSERLKAKRAIVVGAGQTPGETLGNGRAIALRFAQEGAEVFCVDRRRERAEETVSLIHEAGGSAFAHEADVSDMAACRDMVRSALALWGGVEILVNNVGVGGSDAPAHKLEENVFDRIMQINLKASWMTIHEVLPVMREAGFGAIVNISSLASLAGGTQLAYEVSKAGVNRLTTSVATSNARHGVRCNAVLPGLMDTPMAVAGISAALGEPMETVRAARNARVPLRGQMGTAWDTANATLFLASDEARFITGASSACGRRHVGSDRLSWRLRPTGGRLDIEQRAATLVAGGLNQAETYCGIEGLGGRIEHQSVDGCSVWPDCAVGAATAGDRKARGARHPQATG